MINILPMCQWQCDFFDLIFLIGVAKRREKLLNYTCCSLESLQHFLILSSILLFLIGLVSVTPTLLSKKEAHNSALLPCTY